jgi:hypothetical protein
MVSKRSEKMSMKKIEFNKKLKVNRIKADTDDEPLAFWRLDDLIVDYFKANNDRYLEVVKMGYKE